MNYLSIYVNGVHEVPILHVYYNLPFLSLLKPVSDGQ